MSEQEKKRQTINEAKVSLATVYKAKKIFF